MSWYKDLSIGVVIVLLIGLIGLYVVAFRHDKMILKKRKEARIARRIEEAARYQRALDNLRNSGVGNLQDHYKIDDVTRSQIREVVEDTLREQKANELQIRQLINGTRDGMIFGLLAGAIIGGKDAALSGAFTWGIIKGVITGASFYI